MGLSFYYEFAAPAGTTANQLEQFLKVLEFKAKTLGFSPTYVLNVSFDTPERRAFARRLGGGYYVEDERLRGEIRFREGQVDHHNIQAGAVRLVPLRAVVLAVADASGGESCFGFMRFSKDLVDESGSTIMPLSTGDGWTFKDHIETPDPPYRAIVREFEQAGYLVFSWDEFTRADSPSRGP